MKTFASIALLGAVALAKKNLRYVDPEQPCHRSSGVRGAPRIKTPLEYKDEIPAAWNW